jgi:hypothetical protein
MFVGGWFAGLVGEFCTDRSSGAIHYAGLWLTPAGVALASLIVFMAAFPSRLEASQQVELEKP